MSGYASSPRRWRILAFRGGLVGMLACDNLAAAVRGTGAFRTGDRAAEPRAVHRCELHPDAARFALPGSAQGLGHLQCAGQAPVEHAGSRSAALK